MRILIYFFSIVIFSASIVLPANGQDAASSYPAKPIKIIVPFAVGGGSDIIARVIGKELSQKLGQPVVIENRTGAGGSVGSNLALKSAPDGYTLLLISSSFSVNPALYKLPFDHINDISPIVELGHGPMIVTVANNLPIRSFKELISFTKANPDKLAFGTSGQGGLVHFTTEAFMLETNTRMIHIPYKGSADVVPDLISGRIQLFLADAGSVVRHINAGNLRGLAVSTKQRVQELPDVPTLIESGFTAFDMAVWQGLVAPKATPDAIIQKLNFLINEIIRQEDVIKAFKAQYYNPVGGKPQDFLNVIKSDSDRWIAVAKKANIKVD